MQPYHMHRVEGVDPTVSIVYYYNTREQEVNTLIHDLLLTAGRQLIKKSQNQAAHSVRILTRCTCVPFSLFV